MRLADFQAKYMGLVLMKSTWGISYEKMAATLARARMDINPHQAAALFAFHAPFMQGAILRTRWALAKPLRPAWSSPGCGWNRSGRQLSQPEQSGGSAGL